MTQTSISPLPLPTLQRIYVILNYPYKKGEPCYGSFQAASLGNHFWGWYLGEANRKLFCVCAFLTLVSIINMSSSGGNWTSVLPSACSLGRGVYLVQSGTT